MERDVERPRKGRHGGINPPQQLQGEGFNKSVPGCNRELPAQTGRHGAAVHLYKCTIATLNAVLSEVWRHGGCNNGCHA